MNALRSTWFVAILALVLNLGTMVATVFLGLKPLIPKPTVHAEDITDERDLRVWRFDSRAMEELVRELKRKKDDLDQREAQVKELENRILVERAEMDKVRAVIENQQSKIKDYVITFTDAEKKNFIRNVKIYSELPPSSLIAVFSQMKDEEVARYLSLMKNDVITGLFEAMIKTDSGDNAQVKRIALLSDMLRRLHEESLPLPATPPAPVPPAQAPTAASAPATPAARK